MPKSRLITFTALIFLGAGISRAQEPVFDSAGFKRLTDLAEWMYAYDEALWVAGDSLKQGSEKSNMLFCFDESSTWHVISGRFADGRFQTTAHFEIDSGYRIKRISGGQQGDKIERTARALFTAGEACRNAVDSLNVVFGSYIRCNADSTFDAWFPPPVQPSGQLLYGAEFHLRVAADGMTLMNTDRYVAEIKGIWIGQPRDQWLNYRDLEFPTAGGVYFAWNNKDYFKKIFLDTRLATFVLAKDEKGKYGWSFRKK